MACCSSKNNVTGIAEMGHLAFVLALTLVKLIVQNQNLMLPLGQLLQFV